VIENAGMKMQIGAELMLPVAGDVGRQHDRLVALDGARNHRCVGRCGREDSRSALAFCAPLSAATSRPRGDRVSLPAASSTSPQNFSAETLRPSSF
jgi:hypothetical protein